MFTSEWRLRFPKYEATLFFNEESPSPVHVYHTFEPKAFKNLCSSIVPVQNELVDFDIWLQNMALQFVTIEEEPMYPTYPKVFRGSMGGSFKIVAKMIPKSFIIPLTARLLWSSTRNDFFQIFYGVKCNADSYHLIFEDCKYTLHEYLCKFEIRQQGGRAHNLNVMRLLVKHLMYLHGKNICHTNINPWNILLTDAFVPKFSGSGNLQPLTPQLVDEDLRALGKLISFCHSDPTRLDTEEKYRLEGEIPTYSWAVEAASIAALLKAPRRLPSLDWVYVHPWLWQSDKRIKFLKDASEFLEPDTDANQILYNAMKYHRMHYFKFSTWMHKLPKGVVDTMGRSGYDTEHPRDLLRFMRNLLSHWPTKIGSNLLKPSDHDWLGSDTSDTEFNFRSTFPTFLPGLYDFLKDHVARADLKSLECYYG